MNILIIEDNKKLAENIKTVLVHEKYVAEISNSGQDGINKACCNTYDLIILDLGLPDIDGIEVCNRLRKNNILSPILMLTARIDLESKVEGLDIGADDYLTKPFLMDELLARIRALLRRDSSHKQVEINIGNDIKINISNKSVFLRDEIVALSPNEYKIFEYLVLNKGGVRNATEIYESVWGSDNSEILFSDTLKVHIARIRKKLGADVIKTVKGFGYLIE